MNKKALKPTKLFQSGCQTQKQAERKPSTLFQDHITPNSSLTESKSRKKPQVIRKNEIFATENPIMIIPEPGTLHDFPNMTR